VSDQQLVSAVKAAKRSAVYRAQRSRLLSVAPDDVWADGAGVRTFVLFGLRGEPWTYLGFEVDPGIASVTEVSIVQLTPGESELEVTNHGAPGVSTDARGAA
jgi:hypothetical protein